jgi:hypothetical protein
MFLISGFSFYINYISYIVISIFTVAHILIIVNNLLDYELLYSLIVDSEKLETKINKYDNYINDVNNFLTTNNINENELINLP